MTKYTIELMYDDSSKYTITKVFNHNLFAKDTKGVDCLQYSRYDNGSEVTVNLPKRDLAGIKLKTKGAIILIKLKPCAKLVAELDKNW